MARGPKGKKVAKAPSAPTFNKKDASITRINTYEDTLEEGGVDEFMHNRDKISLAPERVADDEEDFIDNQGEEVFSLNLPTEEGEDQLEDEYDEEEEEAPAPKARKSKPAEDKSKKGRYAKESDDDESLGFTDEESESDEDEDRAEESWGRQYYAKPSNRYARDAEDDDYDSDKELSKNLYAQESEALQKNIRRSMKGDEDFGLEEIDDEAPAHPDAVKFSLDRAQPSKKSTTPAPPADADPTKLTNHLAVNEPVKLALARDFPLVVRKLQKTERGIKKMQQDAAIAAKHGGMPQLNQGLGWLHYQSLLTYATMLAFYLHLAALPEDQRPDFSTHPILPRLAQLKEGVSMLEDLDFDAASIDEEDDEDEDDEDEEAEGVEEEDDEDLTNGKAELIGRLVGSTGMDWDDADNLWQGGELEEHELEDLVQDAQGELSDDDLDLDDEEDEEEIPAPKPKSGKKEKKDKSNKKSKFALDEPEFEPAGKNKKSASGSRNDENDEYGDLTVLNATDSADKSAKKRSLRFHTFKIAATSARRAAARDALLGGDDDVPYKSKQAARDAVLRRNSAAGDGGEDLDGSDWSEKDRKRAREVMEAEEAVEADDGYYELVKKRKTEAKHSRKEEYDANAARAIAEQRQDEAEEASSGPRALTRSIEKNRGLTPHRKKSTRNPRVKKREQYEKAKLKVSSQRAVYKGGQSALAGSYSGEKSGISLASKSRRF
ncbi:hypothetical protein QFC24_004111 [Naganishia onofrii]|uniref:Uncharacterized protein n=1 Tax=Naganishia onofrii TaxID=1851511 RepID=A0ACC2XHD8_9TREE|nr:hypothetical protein QFC24_004111 [Naganishia onofrii]